MLKTTSVPHLRVSSANRADVNPGGDYVLYWMIASRRTGWNFALQRAVEWASELEKPLLVLEALRCDYPWASDRLHSFVLDGMADNARALDGTGTGYYPFVERRAGEGKGLLEALAKRASVVVTDEFPAFFLPRAVAAAARRIPVLLEQVDSNGLLPMRAAERAFPTAHSFRRFLQRELPSYLGQLPHPDPIETASFPGLDRLPEDVVKRWPVAPPELLRADRRLDAIDIDHSVRPVEARGGSAAAGTVLKEFLSQRLATYAEQRNDPTDEATSGLSPYLHFGHVSAHEVFARVMDAEGWSPDRLGDQPDGRRSGWWGTSPSAEEFLDQLVTWRELGFNFCHVRADYDSFESLPGWARATLSEHAADPRLYVYTLEEFESAATHDPVWNAAQRQLVSEGRIHNYLRMLWGKKIIEWTASPREALDVMQHLNNRYAVDGRDPNSYSGIFWCLGRYDRAWGPERPVFGEVRFMSSESAKRKLNIAPYLEKYSS